MENSEFTKGSKFSFSNQVEYAKGGIVSKNVIKKSTGNVSLFAFDKGESLSEHTAPFDALAQIIEGDATITIGGRENQLFAGESIIMPANVTHAVHATSCFKMLLTMIRDPQQ